MNPSRTPSVRFKGYEDEWEERKLKDVLYISKARNKSHKYGKEDVLSVSREVGTVNQIEYQGRSFAGSDISNYKVVQGGELIYTKSPLKGAPYGIFQVATLEGILSPLYAVYNSTDKAYTPFVAMALKTDSIATHYLSPLVAKGAKNTINVTDEGALQGKIKFPNILEQKQIFIFFKQLDDTIALHQRKLNLLNEQKKGFLQKMFPKNGEKIPEIRFAGFNDDWEERKFADFIDVKSGKDYKHLNSGSIPVYGTGGYMLSVDRALSDIDAIGIGRKGTIDKPYLLKAPFWTVDTLFYAVPKQNIDLQFSLSIFKKINWKKFDESTGVPSLSKTVINSVGASVPSYEEQQKIGSFFKQLDNTITLHQRKIDELKSMKKSMLQKMFV